MTAQAWKVEAGGLCLGYKARPSLKKHLCVCVRFSKTVFLCVALAVLELTLQTRLALNSHRLACLCHRVLG